VAGKSFWWALAADLSLDALTAADLELKVPDGIRTGAKRGERSQQEGEFASVDLRTPRSLSLKIAAATFESFRPGSSHSRSAYRARLAAPTAKRLSS